MATFKQVLGLEKLVEPTIESIVVEGVYLTRVQLLEAQANAERENANVELLTKRLTRLLAIQTGA